MYKKTHTEYIFKKTLILTLKIGGGYGGIMQAYALQAYLKKLGYDVVTSTPEASSLSKKFRENLLMFRSWLFSRLFHKFNMGVFGSYRYDNIIMANTNRFIFENIDTVNFGKKLYLSGRYFKSFSRIIVGSDQVWRNNYADVLKYLSSFAKIKNRISYAASFASPLA